MLLQLPTHAALWEVDVISTNASHEGNRFLYRQSRGSLCVLMTDICLMSSNMMSVAVHFIPLPPLIPPPSYHLFVVITQEFRLQNEVSDFVLAGHSLGGYLCTRYAMKYPQAGKTSPHPTTHHPRYTTPPHPLHPISNGVYYTYDKYTWV